METYHVLSWRSPGSFWYATLGRFLGWGRDREILIHVIGDSLQAGLWAACMAWSCRAVEM